MGPEPSTPPDAACVVAHVVSVKALCAFGAKAGDLDLRFVPAPSALEGMAGHALVQHRRGEGYESEVGLDTTCGALRVRGRADGYEPRRHRVEEIKTFRGDFDAIRGNHRALHWAQARTYGWMLCEQNGHDRMTVALVYLDLATGDETVLEEHHTREALREHFELLCARYSAWAASEAAHRGALDAALAGLEFPHSDFRAGQRELAEAVYRAAMGGRCLMTQAPTGIGKTLATIFPLLKARAAKNAQGIDKVFFLTAKTSGRPVALDALRVLDKGRGPGRLRVLELAAREKVCEYPDRACHGDACPLARGFYDRLPAAREQAAQAAWLDRAALRDIALAHEVCPYFLAQEMTRWADAVVGDYNYYFDSSAFLYATMRDADWRVAVLVDEAHNLLERARGMYTAPLEGAALEEAHRVAPAALRGPLARLFREWDTVQQPQQAAYETSDEVPERFLRTLQAANTAMAEYFAATPDASQGPLQRFFFDALHFARLAEAFGDHSVFERTLGETQAERTLAIRNLVPAPFLESRFGDAVSVTCFSGTLSPFEFYRDALGLPQNTALLDVASPFTSQQLRVEVATHVSTRFRDRAGSLRNVADIIGAQFERMPGNYLAFFSSFDYLDKACAAFSLRHPGVPVWTQTRGMREADRHDFIARFREGGQGIGFAVLGGAFGEGIDLPGSRLIGAFVASLGLPQYNELNEITRERMQTRFGKGYEYTYLYPGLQKVVQAAGRVIRTEEDRGVLHLLDDRFARAEIRELLPRWWHVQLAERPAGRPEPDASR
ncbi:MULTISPECIES: ATP-dependent DNA helicase [unclassified Variovorax]|uniref:ATP-dependent DNA helicase n=1 Tax=unclassified Variovorax TaxID=663243 RepID=UPI0008BA5BEB|nr:MULTISPECIES: ATP-dependent DNA helicase [unclassified Variovorax]SEJ74276.1 DNA excision repair protein ERCC-2 [Variovorax sp. OK202]SFC86741.1 DNA excision repair protein ERCC-2 [Variovorax sp. OK212]